VTAFTYAAVFFAYNFAALSLETALLRFSTILLDPSPATFVGNIGIWLGASSLGTWLAATHFRSPRWSVPILLAMLGISALLIRAIVTAWLAVTGGPDRFLTSVSPEAVRCAISAILFSVPAFLSGWVFPLFSETFEGRGSRAGTLALSFGGCAFGIFATSFHLLPRAGLGNTILFSASVLLISAAAVGLLRWRGANRETTEAGVTFGTTTGRPLIGPAVRFAFLAGVLAPAAQGALYRVHIMIAGGTTFSAGVAIGTFLLGLALGATFQTGKNRSDASLVRSLATVLSTVSLSLAAAVLLSPHLDRVAALSASLRTVSAPGGILAACLSGVALFLPPSVALGRILPISLEMISRDGKHSWDWRRGYLAYSLGAFCGATAVSLSTASLGTRWLLLLMGMSCLAGAVALEFSSRDISGGKIRFVGGVGIILWLIAAWLSWNPDPFPGPSGFPAGFPRAAPPFPGASQTSRDTIGGETVFLKEGLYGITSLHRKGDAFSLRWNGFGVSHSVYDAVTQRMLALLPVTFGRPSSALVIGLGSGQTFADLVRAGTMDARCVELSPDIVEAARRYGGRYHFPEERVAVGDAKRYLERTAESFDLIVSQPSHPWFSGSGNLFTVDFYRTAAARLSQDGIFCQWMQAYGSDPNDILLLLRTFREVFPAFTAWSPAPGDILLLGRKRLREISLRDWTTRLADPEIRAMLEEIGISGPADLLGMFLFSGKDLLLPAGPVSTYDRPLLEYATARKIGLDRTESVHRFMDSLCRPPPQNLSIPAPGELHPLARKTGQFLAVRSEWTRAERWLLVAWGARENDPSTANDLAMVYHSSGMMGKALEWIRKARSRSDSEEIDYNYRMILDSARENPRLQQGDR
jgi:spermidine synthase